MWDNLSVPGNSYLHGASLVRHRQHGAVTNSSVSCLCCLCFYSRDQAGINMVTRSCLATSARHITGTRSMVNIHHHPPNWCTISQNTTQSISLSFPHCPSYHDILEQYNFLCTALGSWFKRLGLIKIFSPTI